MPKPVYHADKFHKYMAPHSGLPCITMGLVFIVIAVIVFFFAERIALFLFLIILGFLVVVLGIALLCFRCICAKD